LLEKTMEQYIEHSMYLTATQLADDFAL